VARFHYRRLRNDRTVTLPDAKWRADYLRRQERWRAQQERAMALDRRIEAWGVEVYQLAPADRPFGARGKYPKPPRKKDEAGQHLCRWCDLPLKSRARWWCSHECVRAFQLRGDWNVIRRAIAKRDQVCQLCGGQRYTITTPLPHAGSSIDGDNWLTYHEFSRRRDAFGRGMHDHGCPLACALKSDWAVDHIVAVKDGGTDHPDNLRLLCLRCHNEVTAGQHARWALERREARDGRAPEVLDLFADRA
jgi:HNH endonuclease